MFSLCGLGVNGSQIFYWIAVRINELWRSTRMRKPNPKQANAAITEDLKELSTFDEAFRSIEWRKAMEEEVHALKQNQTKDFQSLRMWNPFLTSGSAKSKLALMVQLNGTRCHWQLMVSHSNLDWIMMRYSLQSRR